MLIIYFKRILEIECLKILFGKQNQSWFLAKTHITFTFVELIKKYNFTLKTEKTL